jgi:hypothetical protein
VEPAGARPAAAAPTGVAHSSQNFAVGRKSAPQLEQTRASGVAHSSQNFALGRFSWAQEGQIIKWTLGR